MSGCRSVLCIFITVLLRGSCSSTADHQRASLSFSNSLRLTRTVRARVQQLLLRYKEQQFGDSLFEDRRLVLNTLPSVTINYKTWLRMQDSERLSVASRDLYIFWTHLERQKLELENEESNGERVMQRRNKRGRPQLTLSQNLLGIQLDIRDLLRQINSQLGNIKQETTTAYTHTPYPSSTFSSLTHPTSTLHPTRSSGDFSNTAIPTSNPTSSDTSPTSSPIPSMPDPSSPIPSMPDSSSSTTSISGPRTTLGLVLTSTPWDMEAINGRQTVSLNSEAASSYEVTQTSPVTDVSTNGRLKLTTQVSGPSRWVSRLEGYVILRDLERYLSRLARDYSLLRSKV